MAVRLLEVFLWGLLATAAAQFSMDRPQCSPAVGDRCVFNDVSIDEYYYTVNGKHHLISFSEGGYYTAKCGAAALGDAALPAFARRKRFARVTLAGCAPRDNASYADALAALNVTVTERLILKGLPKDTHLTAASFVGLPPLKALELTHSSDGVIVLGEGVLEPLEALRSLVLVGVRPARLPRRLDALRLRYTGLRALPPEALSVVTLEVVEDDLTDMGGPAPRLETLTLSAPVLAAPAAPALRRASVSRWRAAAPAPWRDCARLELLSLTRAAARRLPAGFVAACPNLHTLELQMMQAEELPKGFLLNASALTSFKAANWPLKSLPSDLFEYSPQLREVDLSNNGLESLPSGLFAPVVGSLRSLSLARNKLSASDVLTVAPLTALRVLNLSNNSLGDLCPAASANLVSRSVSYLYGLKRLEQLVLSRTGATRVCADWTHHMHALRRLDLTHNRIEELQFADLKIQREVSPADVDVSRNPLRAVRCSRDDYLLAAGDALPQQTAKLIMDSRIACTCETYWLALALRHGRVAAAFEPRCDAAPRDPPGSSILNKPLRNVELSDLVCELPPNDCATNCTCLVEPYLEGLSVTCRGVDDLRLDNLTSTGVDVKHVYATGVKRLPTIVPSTIKLLDLSDGSIESASAEEAAALFAHGAKVRLARNPLRCDCGHRALLDALHANQALVQEYANTTCADNRTVSAARDALTCAGPGAAGALVALCGAALAAALAVALLARPETRLRLKAFLHSRGVRARWLARRLEPRDEDRFFDAFVAHADHDARFVAETLAATLESGPRPYRLCLDYRDWPAGAWIPTQIEASIRYSRRTVALVSKHFLSSRWARAELRSAHAAAIRERTPRIVIILLDVCVADLDAELRALAAAHAAVRWGEPWFWEKLRYALPDARDPAWRREHADWPGEPDDPEGPPAAA